MTKRALSLLLALIMALSLCVPAFAAEGDEAEPVAAEGASEPEAAPAAEEEEGEPEAEVAPVAADEPVTIAVVDSLAILQTAVSRGNGMKAAVKNGDYQPVTVGNNSACDDFLAALDAAEKLLNEITTEGGIEVWLKSHSEFNITDKTNVLQLAIARITDNMNTDQLSNMDAMITVLTAISKLTDKYQPSYISEVTNAIAQLKAYKSSGKYVDYKAARELYESLRDAGASSLETVESAKAKEAKKPIYADYLRLKEVVDDAKAKLASGKYVHNLINDQLAAYIEEKIEINFMPLEANGLSTSTTYADVNWWISQVKDMVAQLVLGTYTAKISNAAVNGAYDGVFYTIYIGTRADDDHIYEVKASYNGSKEVSIQKDIQRDWGIAAGDLGVEWVLASKFNVTKFAVNTAVTINLYDQTSGAIVDTKVVTVGDYNGPQITSGKYDPATLTFSVNVDKSLDTANYHVGTDGKYESAYFTVTDPNGKVVVAAKKLPLASDATGITFSVTEATAVIGDYKFDLYVTESGANGLTATVARGVCNVTLPDITNYKGDAVEADEDTDPYGLIGAKGYNNLLKAIAAAEGASDLVSAYPSVRTTQQARDILAHNLEAAKAIVANAANIPNTAANESKVNTAIDNLRVALSYLTEGADPTDLEAALEAAGKLVESDYVPASWAALKSAVDAGKAIVKKLPYPESMQDDLDDAAEAIENAIKALVAYVPDMTTLKALVDSVPGKLAADDYTAESKAAVEAAAAEASALLTKKGALKSEVKAATEKLQAALNALTVDNTPKGPGAPAGGTGWVHSGPNWYYYQKGVMLTNSWFMSAKGLWYYLGADGVMYTGFQKVGAKYFYFTPGGSTVGAVQSGWIVIGETSKGKDNWGWFQTKHNGHFGECTYTTEWGNL